MRPTRLVTPLLLLLLGSCAHTQRAGAVDSMKRAAELFHQRTRWRDHRSAAELVVPERRQAFLEAREKLNDEKDLSISDYDLEELTLNEGNKSGRVVSRVSWMRLPSLSERSETVRTDLYLIDGAWLIGRQDRGPFADVLSEPYEPPAPPAPEQPAAPEAK